MRLDVLARPIFLAERFPQRPSLFSRHRLFAPSNWREPSHQEQRPQTLPLINLISKDIHSFLKIIYKFARTTLHGTTKFPNIGFTITGHANATSTKSSATPLSPKFLSLSLRSYPSNEFGIVNWVKGQQLQSSILDLLNNS